MPPLFTPEQWVQPECGTATFRMRVDLWLAARKAGVGGKVDSKVVNYGDGMGPRRSGINVGYSFDWEQC
ncbi:hypothetical protein M011DRAFT_468446 [Sporormia fimetaria CBS 119925]|uniref:Uncharacterized protein n=1 Tax=Sporormia fimetaria CBS 119925 TaxID=1340428 RepID=A0A6A6V7V7_9PLEO|nr:hypothetical protein M011DRAFT_468446 [Sporormia fimetaria CBS 119925]